MASITAGIAVLKAVTSPAAIGFIPVAIEFRLFDLLVELKEPVNAERVLAAYKDEIKGHDAKTPNPGVLLIADTLFAMAGLGFVDITSDELYSPNEITRHLAAFQSAQHGALHFATEALLGATFLMPKLKAENLAYPFEELDTPIQYGYRQMGNEQFAKQHTYSIMAEQGRMDSFNIFMAGKFMKANSVPERMKVLGYDFQFVLNEATADTSRTLVDIGGGRGELLLEIKEAFPQLQTSDLVVQEFNDDIGNVEGVTQVTWDFKAENSPQPIKGALVYHLAHILHNLPDLEAVRLLQKISEAMAPHSRLLLHEFGKNANHGKMHATMIVLFGGRERSSSEWHQMAALAGLKVTFEVYPPFGEGLIEMRKA
ncbi:O-methyltransferase [Aspergillus steynii IBT 23096]|uniref:O-methyltransferase n=1 Tax=Aspergillus steynii IBT 23096 TaxID=1392250 RepID=A0A2I2GM10_9EURO|nr:O-methyltransferase [Aspergillus steynii IBT 23096]PLB53915.1 O-methyltransferase [Aspergillus steynii IBT 23096]